MAKATTKSNLFDRAKKGATVKSAKEKDKKVRLEVDAELNFYDKVEALEKLQDNMKRDKAKADVLSDELKDITKEKWCKYYQKLSKNPGSVFFEEVKKNGDTAQLMFVPSDKYISVNEERADELMEQYGEEIIERKDSFAFDSDMVEKYGEILSELIEACEDIPEDDKYRIIKATTSFAIAKGTIDRIKDFGNIESVVEAIKPVFSLKNVEVSKINS